MNPEVNPAWVRFGVEVKKLRSKAGLTQVQIHSRTGISASMLSAIENATRAPKRNHAELLDKALSTHGALVRLWLDINDSVNVPDWWRNIGVMERNAVEIREYQMTFVPGLIQTDAYIRTAMRQARRWDSADVIERDVEARTSRLDKLREDVFLWFVVDEYAFTRVVGDEQIMRAQLSRVLDLIAQGRIQVQVITQPRPLHPGMSGPLRVLDFQDRSPVALVEHLVGEEVIDSPQTVRQCRSLFGALQAEALSLSDSARMLEKLREDYG
ncbi:transcriptional regulator with XRE-family HTH domain [Nocardiopsis mwathae]|uniref:Transcriptional regulator with XRE-family HTH domain n=1 Tax=Nocardiopsis mwathae TaxID=1472723 RepID=A0A7W9YGY0_9ACTN|nr:helix-turn-helix transcriptional regulator [Nocardiopsis mwathae]MBB6171953.1 transcriptional regulator with XRE-family HTH domain [Nocardiopsis mwathae]